ncbi:ABC transporter ATP-binding protein [Oricola sp.]|uniref:ABC transporter ATP-binding protein n=1 Tax=Oricola sp. TaxID=1979950 RepID=UPI003BAA6712
MLQISNVSGGYGRNDLILKGVSADASSGEIVAIVGPNGAGKSTLLKAIAGQLPVANGSIRLNEKELMGLRPRHVALAGVSYVPQEANVFASMTVRENLEIGATLAPDRNGVDRMLDRFPILREKRRDSARTLSGGQRQILAMAIAMMTAPQLLLLDEPSAGLSPIAATELFATIREIAAGGVAIVLVEQNALEALDLAHRAYILAAGANHKSGTGAELAADPDIRRTFLGG